MRLQEIHAGGIESTRYLERYVNNVKEKPHSHYSDTLPKYSPHEGIEQFPAPVFNLPPEAVTVLQADPDPRLMREVIGSDVKFIIHPEMLDDIEYLERTGLNDFAPDESYVVTPTSSTRTLLTKDRPDYNFMIKTDLEKRHYKFIRRLKGTSVEHSIAISNQLGEACSTGRLEEFAYLPESIGITLGDKVDGAGVLFREIIPRPLVDDDRVLVPYFSLYANDLKHPEEETILRQLIDHNTSKGEELDYFVNVVAGKLIRSWTKIAREFGVLPELHGQNTLLEIDGNMKPQRIVYRDFQGTYVDPDIRAQNGLDMPFSKHIVGTESGTDRARQFSHIYDHNIGHLLLRRLTDTFISEYPEYNFEAAASEIAKQFNDHFPEARDIMPNAAYKVGPVVENEVQMVQFQEKPTFR